jgi:hypothetical protein
MGMPIGFNQYLTHGPLTSDRYVMEAQGVTKERIGRGDIIFIDQDEIVWTATSWQYFPRHLDKDSTMENPDFLKWAKEVDHMVGKITQDKSKGLLVVNIRDDKSNDKQVGKFTTKPEEPSKIDNQDMSDLGFKRVTRKGGQFQTLTSNEFLKGHPTITLRGVTYYRFTALEDLKARILKNMKESKYPMLRMDPVINATKKFLDGGAKQFDWGSIQSIMSAEDRTKFGIYLVSELCYPFRVWTGQNIQNFPGFSKVRGFLVPISSDNAGFDSAVYGNLVGGGVARVLVSSKAKKGGNAGARASILPTLNRIARTNAPPYDVINNKFLRLLLPHFRNTQQGKKSIYPFMIRDVLKITDINPEDLHTRICGIHGKRIRAAKGLTSEITEKTEREVQKIQDKVKASGGIVLPGLNIKAPINHNAAKYLDPIQWKDFSRYLSDLFCDAIAYGLNHDDGADLKPESYWQVTLDNSTFIDTGTANFSVKSSDSNVKGVKVTNGKQTPGDPTRNITWLGAEPL